MLIEITLQQKSFWVIYLICKLDVHLCSTFVVMFNVVMRFLYVSLYKFPVISGGICLFCNFKIKRFTHSRWHFSITSCFICIHSANCIILYYLVWLREYCSKFIFLFTSENLLIYNKLVWEMLHLKHSSKVSQKWNLNFLIYTMLCQHYQYNNII